MAPSGGRGLFQHDRALRHDQWTAGLRVSERGSWSRPRGCCCRCCRCRPVRSRATSRWCPTVPPDAAGLTVLYPLADTPHRLPTVPGEQTLLTDDELAGRWRRRAGWAGWSRRSPRGRRRVRPSGTPPASPSIPTSSRRPRRCAGVRGARARRRRCPAPAPRSPAPGWTRSRRPRATAASSRCPSPTRTSSRWPAGSSPTWRHGGRRRGRDGRRGPRHARCSRRPPGPAAECSTSRRSTAVAAGGARAVLLYAGAVERRRDRARPAGRSRSRVGASSLLAVLTDPLLARAAAAPDAPTRAVAGAADHVPAGDEPAAGHPGRRRRPRVPGPERADRAAGRARPAAPVGHRPTGRPRAARRRGPAARFGPDAARGLADAVRRRADDAGGPAGPRTRCRPAAASPAGVLESVRGTARRRARPALGRRARHRGRRHRRRDVRPARAGPRCARLGHLARPAGPRPVDGGAGGDRIGELRDSVAC